MFCILTLSFYERWHYWQIKKKFLLVILKNPRFHASFIFVIFIQETLTFFTIVLQTWVRFRF